MQELLDLKNSILEGRYEDALAIVDELEGMSRQAILRNIESFLVRLLVHLIKNQVEQRLTNSWAASITDSVRQIQKLNFKANCVSYYVASDEWEDLLQEAIEAAIDGASVEVRQGEYSPFQLAAIVDRIQVMQIAQTLLGFTYQHPTKAMPAIVKEYLVQLPGGEEWKLGRRSND